ncbi:MAG: hypothetical protein ACAI38_06210 [Myxococcota bacterium]
MVSLRPDRPSEPSIRTYAPRSGPSIWDENPLGMLMALGIVASIPVGIGVSMYQASQARSHAQAVYRQTALDQSQVDNVRRLDRGTFIIKAADGRELRAQIRYTDADAEMRQVLRRNHRPLPTSATDIRLDTSNRVVRYNDGNTQRTDPLPPDFTETPRTVREQVGETAGRTAVQVGRGAARGALEAILGRDKP